MPCALLLLLLSLGHDLAAKKEKNRMRDENKKSVLLKPREIVLSTPGKKKQTLGARHASYSARIELKPRPQVPDGLPVST